MVQQIRVLFIAAILGFSVVGQAGQMRRFLTSCAYGTGVGALAGVTALAFSEKPGENLNYVARGASLGLYAGIGVGIFLVNQPEDHSSDVFLIPQRDGAALAWQAQF